MDYPLETNFPETPVKNKKIKLYTILVVLFLVSYIFIIRPASALISGANVLKKDFAEISDSLANRDLVQLDTALDKTEVDLNDIRKDRESKFGWAKGVKFLRIGEYYDDSDRFINVGLLSVTALRQTSQIVTPFADAAGLKVLPDQVVPESDGLMDAFQTWVSIMPEVADQMDVVIETVTLIGKELEPVNVDKYPKSFRGIPVRDNIAFAKNTLSKSSEFAPDIKKALVIIPELLGVGSPVAKRYFVIFLNDKEIRATGGFQTYFATFRLQNGLLQSDFTSYNFYHIDDVLDLIDATYDFPDAPLAYSKYLKVERWYARDTNNSPDLPTSVENLMFYYDLAGTIDPTTIKPIDGIITIDTRVLEELLQVTGPVTVNGFTYTADNVVLELETIASLALKDQGNRKRVLGDLMEEMLINVFESDKNLWSKLIDKGANLAVRKHIQLYMFNTPAQELLEKYNFAGRIATPVDGDHSMVVSTNLGGDKTNWFVYKEIDHALTKENGRWMDTVTVKYTYPQPAAEFSAFVKRFRDWFRIYAPAGSELVSLDGSEDAEMNMTGEERGMVWYSGLLELGPNESKTVTVKYYLPENVVVGDTYKLLIQKQGGINSELHTVHINGKKVDEIQLDRDTAKTYSL